MTYHYGMTLFQVLRNSVANALRMRSEEKFDSSILFIEKVNDTFDILNSNSVIKMRGDGHVISSRWYWPHRKNGGLRWAATAFWQSTKSTCIINTDLIIINKLSVITAQNSFALHFLATHKYWEDKNIVKFIWVQQLNFQLFCFSGFGQSSLTGWVDGKRKWTTRILVGWRRVNICREKLLEMAGVSM